MSDPLLDKTNLALMMGLLSYLQKVGRVDLYDLEKHLSNFVIREEFRIDDETLDRIKAILWEVRKLQ